MMAVLGDSNDALYSATHPSSTSNVGPTARIFSRYVDVVPVGQWVILPEKDGRLIVEVLNNQQDRVSLIFSYRGKDKCQLMTECVEPADLQREIRIPSICLAISAADHIIVFSNRQAILF
jgi:hypothetical protein